MKTTTKRRLSVLLLGVVTGAIPLLSNPAWQNTGQTTGSWRKMSQPAPVAFRGSIGAVLSGNTLVVWGGEVKDTPASDGAVYDIDRDLWRKMAPAPVEGREHFTMVARGNTVIIWGGENNPHGAIYDVARDAWQKMAPAPMTLGMEPYTSGVLGDRLFVWGIGKTADLNPVGGIYDIARNTWKKTALLISMKAVDDWPPLFYRNRFIVWGGPSAGTANRHGAIYDADKDEWKDMAPAPIARRNWPAAVLAGNRLVIWGGCDGPVEAHTATSQADGAVYDIDRGTWKKMAAAPLQPRFLPRAFLWGHKVVIWGGLKDRLYYDGAIYDLETDTWETIPEAPLKSANARELYSYGIFGYNPTPPALWRNKLVVWSFYCHAVYDLAGKTWTEMAASPIGGRDYQVSLLHGDTLILWGGRDEKRAYSDGAILDLSK